MLARAAIRRLRTGLVPYWELERLSVGYGRIKHVVNEGFDALRAGGAAQPLFIRGEWGTGKTHFLSFVRGVAKSRNVPAARVDLNARSAAMSHPQRFYSAIAKSICTSEHEGLRAILAELLHESQARSRVRAFATSDQAGDFCGPLHALTTRYDRGEHLEAADDLAWSMLYGVDLSWADYTYKREQATARIRSLGRLLAAVGMVGLVIVFDEAETIDQLWNVRSRMSAYGVLGQLCRLGAVWPIFGITHRFDRIVEADLARGVLLQNATTESASWFLKAWQRDRFAVLEPPGIEVRNARSLANTVAELYAAAYPDLRVDDRLVESCLDDWLRNPARNPRRLIRLLVHRLDASRQLRMVG